jgi:uncharacterized protein YraI
VPVDRRLLAWLTILIVWITVACNLGVAPTPRPSPTAVQKPTVSIQAPQNNADAVVGQAITVQATGSHPDGVTRIELRVNSQQVDSKVSQNAAGDQQFSAYLNYTPTVEGSLLLEVISYRGNVASDPAVITVNVKSQQSQVTATVAVPTGSANDAVQATYDPRCRARVEVNGLNFRQGPGQNYDRLQLLGLGTIVFVTGRLQDNTWWQGHYGNTVGWVSASYVTLLGTCYGIQAVIPSPSPAPTATITTTAAPTVAQATNTPGKPDLIVSELSGPVSMPLDDNGSKVGTYRIMIQNVGTISTGAFNVGLVLPDGTLRDLGSVAALLPGQSALVQTDVTFTAPGSARLIAIVDSNNTVDETNEANNLKPLDIVIIKPTLTATGAGSQ